MAAPKKSYDTLWTLRSAHLRHMIRTRSSELARMNYNADVLRASLKTAPDRIESITAHSGQDFDYEWSLKNYEPGRTPPKGLT
jgi:hypothetical protein